MTRDKAKIALGLSPPEDETNPDVPDLDKALELVAAHPEFATWWEQEKNFDLIFHRKLASLDPPVELKKTIMRGGATIFFASRLIAETAGETLDELPPLPENLETTSSGSTALPMLEKTPPTPRGRSSGVIWLWRLAIFAVMAVFLLAILAVFLAFNPHPLNTGGAPELPDLLQFAASVAQTNPNPATHQTPEEMEKFVSSSNAPDLGDISQLTLGDKPLAVYLEEWKSRPVTHYVMQGANGPPYHIFVLFQNDFPRDPVTTSPLSENVGDFHAAATASGPFIRIVLVPK